MSERDPIIGAAFDALAIPDHRTDFIDDLATSIATIDRGRAASASEPASVTADVREGDDVTVVNFRPPVENHRRPQVILASAAAAVIVAMFALISSLRPAARNTTIIAATDATTSSIEPAQSSAPGDSVPVTTTGPVSEEQLRRAEATVLAFLDELQAGDDAAAGARLGPRSETLLTQQMGSVGAFLAQTEGIGAWARSTDRNVTTLGMAPGVAVVVLEGTVQVEGSSEHRVSAFPVVHAESADAWFVEAWGYPIADPPVAVSAPSLDAQERAGSGPISLQAKRAGTALVAFGTAAPRQVDLAAGDARQVDGAGELVTMLYRTDGEIIARAFIRRSTSPSPQSFTVPFLDQETNALLRRCAQGDASACDSAQVPGVLDDGAFTWIHTNCNAGNAVVCTLLDNLVAAELRMHERDER